MPHQLQQVDWMPSPPLAPADDPIDAGHLDRMTLGDAGLARDVLAMFAAQAASLSVALAATPCDATLAHTLKGSARAVGAFDVAGAAEHLEFCVERNTGIADALNDLDHAVTRARAAIDEILQRS